MGLTRGVKSHRLSGQISPYCEKNVIGSARIARLCFNHAEIKAVWLSVCLSVCLLIVIHAFFLHTFRELHSYHPLWHGYKIFLRKTQMINL